MTDKVMDTCTIEMYAVAEAGLTVPLPALSAAFTSWEQVPFDGSEPESFMLDDEDEIDDSDEETESESEDDEEEDELAVMAEYEDEGDDKGMLNLGMHLTAAAMAELGNACKNYSGYQVVVKYNDKTTEVYRHIYYCESPTLIQDSGVVNPQACTLNRGELNINLSLIYIRADQFLTLKAEGDFH
jgi:hypothetical protein